MYIRLLKVLVWTAGVFSVVLVAGILEATLGGAHIVTAVGRFVERPRFELALARGAAGGCDQNSIQPSMEFLRIWEETARLKRTSRALEKGPGGLTRWETPHGIFWAPRQTALSYVLAEQVLDVYQSPAHRVQEGDIVLDCGANVGVFTKKALDQGAAVVVAVEPVPQNVESLKRTFAKEIASGRVIVEPVGVWHKDDVLKMTVFDNSTLDSFVMKDRLEEDGPKGEIELPVTTVDSIVTRLKLARVDFIKMDVEGAERNALEGATATIARYRPMMSIASENLEDDYIVLPRKIREIDPQYALTCAICKSVGWATIRPDILFFNRPRRGSPMIRAASD